MVSYSNRSDILNRSMGPCASSQQDKPVFMTEELQNTKIEGFSSIYRKSGVHQLEYKPYP